MSKLTLSTGSFLGRKTIPWFPFLTLLDFASTASMAGYDGIEILPSRFRMTNEILNLHKTERPDLLTLSSVHSAHQSFRSEEHPLAILTRHKPLGGWLKATFAYIFLPERRNSMAHMVKLQEAMTNKPTVIYPWHIGAFGGKEWNEDQYQNFWFIDIPVVQPSAQLLWMWGVNNSQEFIDKAKGLGFKGICLDTKHIREEYTDGNGGHTYQFEGWTKSIPIFLHHTKLVHIQPASVDDDKTEKIVEFIAQSGWEGTFVVELKADLLKPGLLITKQQFIDAHSKLSSKYRKIINES